jgi:hypothetical protein
LFGNHVKLNPVAAPQMVNIVIEGVKGVGKNAMYVRLRDGIFVESHDGPCDPTTRWINVDNEEHIYDLIVTSEDNNFSAYNDLTGRTARCLC